MIRLRLWQSLRLKNIVDLKGRQIVGPKGTVLHHLLSAALKSSGVEMKDVNWVSMNLPASLTTLLGGRADAALLAAGGILAAEKAGFHALVKAKGLIETNLVLAARGDFAKEYPDVETYSCLVDAACMYFVKEPWRFQVIVTSNLFGDIITDLRGRLLQEEWVLRQEPILIPKGYILPCSSLYTVLRPI